MGAPTNYAPLMESQPQHSAVAVGQPRLLSMDELQAMKTTIGRLQSAYIFLFGGSLVILVGQGATGNITNPGLSVVWALCLGGAVCTRIYRTSLVNKYNAAVTMNPMGALA